MDSSEGWSVYAEGGANVLYSNEDFIPGRLLRLRKKHDFKVSTTDVYRFLNDEFRPRVGPNWLISCEQIEVPKEFYTNLPLNEKLDTTEPYGFLLDNANFTELDPISVKQIPLKYGSLRVSKLEDLSTSICLEFKPKWLIQSPNAPSAALQCRTCAHRGMTGRPKGFCPLDLASNDLVRVRKAVEELLEGVSTLTFPLVDILTQYFTRTNLLDSLKSLQSLDTKGPLTTDSIDPNFLIAMSARDCTIFIQVLDEDIKDGEFFKFTVNNTAYWIRAKLADLDLKNTLKQHKWASVEKSLEPWYNHEQGKCIFS